MSLTSCAAAPIDLSLDVSTVGEGSVAVTPAQPTYTSGTPVTLTATPDEGAYFAGWSGDLVSGDNPLQFAITQDTAVTATFEAMQQTQTAWLAFTDMFRLGVPVEVAVNVTGGSTAPGDGIVRVDASSGEFCEAAAPSTVGAQVSLYLCDISFTTPGTRLLKASYLGGTRHLPSATVGQEVHAVRFVDVSVHADDGASVAVPGAPASYLVEVRNAGPDEAVAVPLQISIAPELQAQAWSCLSQGGAACPQSSGTGSVDTQVTLPSGSGLDYLFAGDYAADLDGVSVLSAQALPQIDAPSYSFDPNPADNTATDVNLPPGVFADGFED